MHETPVDCSIEGCGWPVAYEFTLPDDWRSGVYIVRSYAQRDGEVFDHRHMFILRPAEPGRDARMVLVCATGTWMAYNEWGGSNHYEGIIGPNNDEFSTRLSIHRPWSRGFVWLPKGAPRIALAHPPAQNATVRYPHMEWSYTNGYSKKYASAGWASYERNFAVWAEEQGYALDIIAQHDLPDQPDILGAYDCAVFIGHDEYWSWEMRDAVDAYVEGGGKAARFAGNFMWQTRLEDDGATQICHKYNARENDPLRETERSTTSWEAPEVGRPGALTFGLNASQGVYTRYGFCCPRAPGGFTVYRPEHWALDGSDLYYGDVFGGESTIFGYEDDGLDYTVRHGLPYPTGDDGAPGGVEIIAMGLATLVEDHHGHEGVVQYLEDLDARFIAETLYYEATEETIDRVKRGSGMMVAMPKGQGEVFHAGTANWVAGLGGRTPRGSSGCPDRRRCAGPRDRTPARWSRDRTGKRFPSAHRWRRAQKAAAMPRPSAIPPVAMTGTRTASNTCGTNAIVPMPSSSKDMPKVPRCPPASQPWAMTASTPAVSSALASATFVAEQRMRQPMSLRAATMAASGKPKWKLTTAGLIWSRAAKRASSKVPKAGSPGLAGGSPRAASS